MASIAPRGWRSLRVRLLLATIVVVLIAVGVTALVVGRSTTGEFQRFVARGGEDRYFRYATRLSQVYGMTLSWDDIQPEVERLSEVTGQRVVVADSSGTIVGDSDNKLVGKPVSTKWPPPSAALVANRRPVGFLFVDPAGAPPPAEVAFLSGVRRSLLFGALIAGAAAVLITLVLSGRIVRPVEQLTEAAQRMEKGDLTVRVEVDSDDEIGQLAHAFNAMAGGLEQQEHLRRNMVGDVAHELRTPLTNLRGYLEAARDGLLPPNSAFVDNLYEETMLLQRLVADLQDLAQAEAGQLRLARQPIALAGVVDHAVAAIRPQAIAKDIVLGTDLPTDLPQVDGDPERIGQVLRNLISNAVAHTPQGGKILVAAKARDGQVAVAVQDTGAGIAPEHLPFVFDRFYRADASRARQTGGAGLGLAIVKQLVLAHGGTVDVTSEPGQGSTFTFTLPIEPRYPPSPDSAEAA
jgi:two-component system sensor histidine kinase BaeS